MDIINWQTIIYTAIGSASGACIVLLIDYFLTLREKSKINFNEAISIQLELHQMLGIALRIQKFNEEEKRKILIRLRHEHTGISDHKLWTDYGFIHLPMYQGDLKTVSSKWILTQFLTYERGNTRAIVKHLADAQLSYQIMKEKVISRNRVLDGQVSNEKLKEVTKDYFDAISPAIRDSFLAFRKLYDYIENKFCHSTPVKLGYRNDSIKILEEECNLSKKDMKTYFEQSTNP